MFLFTPSDTEVRRRASADLWLAASRANSVIAWPLAAGEDECSECDRALADMTTHQRDLHIVRQGRVLVGCEGYHTPVLVHAFRFWLQLAERGFGFRTGDRISLPNGLGLRGTVTEDHMAGDDAVYVEWDADEFGGPYEDEIPWRDIRHVLTVPPPAPEDDPDYESEPYDGDLKDWTVNSPTPNP